MSYRTYIENTQVFGNNDAFPEWIEFIRSQGIAIDPELKYDGYLHDFGAALSAVEAVAMRLDADARERRRSFEAQLLDPSSEIARKHLLSYPDGLFDLSAIRARAEEYRANPQTGESLFDGLWELAGTGYLFLPLQFHAACADLLERDYGEDADRAYGFKLKPGRRIHISAG